MKLPVQTIQKHGPFGRRGDAVSGGGRQTRKVLRRHYELSSDGRGAAPSSIGVVTRFTSASELAVPGKELVVAHGPSLRSALKHEDEAQWKKNLALKVAPTPEIAVAAAPSALAGRASAITTIRATPVGSARGQRSPLSR